MSPDYILLFGLPGTGKGTLAKRISSEFPIAHISCGDVFRRHVNMATEFGKTAKSYIEKGQLTPDSETSQMFLEHLKGEADGGAYLVEGFPRTVAQARDFQIHLLESGRKVVSIISLEASDDVLEMRLLNRRMCPRCQRIYNLRTDPPLRSGLCDDDEQPLVRRSDDREGVIRPRIDLYRRSEDAVLAFYQDEYAIHRVNADLPMGGVHEAVRKLLSGSFL